MTASVELVAARSGKVEYYQTTTIFGADRCEPTLAALHEEALSSAYVSSVFRAHAVPSPLVTVIITSTTPTMEHPTVVGSLSIDDRRELHFFATKDYCTEARTIALFQMGVKAALAVGCVDDAHPMVLHSNMDNLPMLRLLQKISRSFPAFLFRCSVQLEGPIVCVSLRQPKEALAAVAGTFEAGRNGTAVLHTCPGVRAELVPTPFDRFAENAANLWRRSKKASRSSCGDSDHTPSRRASGSSTVSASESVGYPASSPLSFEFIHLRQGTPVWISAGDMQWRAAYWKTSELRLQKYDGECRQHAHVVYAVRAEALDTTLVGEGNVQIFPLHGLCYVAVPLGETVVALDDDHAAFVEAELV